MTELSCNVVRDLLPLYAEDMTSEESRALIEAHLENCEFCRVELETMQIAPKIKPKTEQSLWHVKNRLRGIKIVAIFVAGIAVFAGLATTALALRVSPGANTIKFEVIDDALCHRSGTRSPGFYVGYAFGGPYEISRTLGEDGIYDVDVVYFLHASRRPIWPLAWLGFDYPGGWTVPFDHIYDVVDQAWTIEEIRYYLDNTPEYVQQHPWLLEARFRIMQIYFVPWQDFHTLHDLDDQLSEAAMQLTTLLWCRETDM